MIESLKTYYPNINIVIPLFSVSISLLIFYFSQRSRKREIQDRKRHEQELKKIYETSTHQPAEFSTTHKLTEEYKTFLARSDNKKITKKFRLVRPSPSTFKTFLFGLLVLFLDTLLVVFWNEKLNGSTSSILENSVMVVVLILWIYAMYLFISSIIRAIGKFFNFVFKKTYK
jgi:hypothetical protein